MARSTASTATKEATPPANSSPASQQDNTDFLWTYTEEPHRTRRLAIIKAHPEVTPPVTPSRLEALFKETNMVQPRSLSCAAPNP